MPETPPFQLPTRFQFHQKVKSNEPGYEENAIVDGIIMMPGSVHYRLKTDLKAEDYIDVISEQVYPADHILPAKDTPPDLSVADEPPLPEHEPQVQDDAHPDMPPVPESMEPAPLPEQHPEHQD